MAIKSRGLIILCFLIAAIFCYAIGSLTGLVIIFALGVVFELIFWAKLLRKRR